MNIEIELKTYKSLVTLFDSDNDNFDKVITRLIGKSFQVEVCEPIPVNQKDPGYWVGGSWQRFKNGIDAYVTFITWVSGQSDDFFEEYSKACAFLKGKRPYVAKEPRLLYPGNPSLTGFAKEIFGWWIDGNISNKQKKALMHLAARTAGLTEGTDYKIFMPCSEH